MTPPSMPPPPAVSTVSVAGQRACRRVLSAHRSGSSGPPVSGISGAAGPALGRTGAGHRPRDAAQPAPAGAHALGEETIAPSLMSPGNTLTAHEITNRLLDVATVLRAAQAIAGEIDMQRLLERVLRIILTNSGAQRGVLVLAALPEDAEVANTAAGDFTIVGIACLEPEEVRAGLSLPMDDNGREVPVSAIRLVAICASRCLCPTRSTTCALPPIPTS